MHPYERWILRRYLANALRASRFARPPRRDKDIATWIESHARLLGLPDLAPGAGSSRRSCGLDGPIDSASWFWRIAPPPSSTTRVRTPKSGSESPVSALISSTMRARTISEARFQLPHREASFLLSNATWTP